MKNIKKGDVVYLVKDYILSTVVDPEKAFPNKRPYVVISNDYMNRSSNNCIVAPLTKKEKKPLPVHVKIDNEFHTAMLEEIHTISKDKIERFSHHISDEDLKKIEKCIAISFGLTYHE